MATIEERLTAIEHGYVELKEKVELQTMAIGALVNKTTLELLNEKYDKLFGTLIAHDEFTNQQLAELREHVEVKLEGKVVGMHTEMRLRFEQQDGKLMGMQTEMRQRFDAVNARFEQIDARFEKMDARFEQIDARFEKMDARFEQQDSKLQQILDLLIQQRPQA